jgi:hypothetical protein
MTAKNSEGKVTEKDTQYPSANVALERLLEMAGEAGLPKSEAVNQAHTTPSGVRPQIEVVADLLMAARMACSDLPPDARSALRTLLLVIAMLCTHSKATIPWTFEAICFQKRLLGGRCIANERTISMGKAPESLNNVSMLGRVAQFLGLT